MLDLGRALGIAVAGFAAGYGACEIISYRRRKAALRRHHELGLDYQAVSGSGRYDPCPSSRPDPKPTLFAKSRMEFIHRVDEIVLGLALVM